MVFISLCKTRPPIAIRSAVSAQILGLFLSWIMPEEVGGTGLRPVDSGVPPETVRRHHLTQSKTCYGISEAQMARLVVLLQTKGCQFHDGMIGSTDWPRCEMVIAQAIRLAKSK